MRRHLLALIAAGLTATASSAAFATETLRVYGPGAPLPAMKEAAAVFGQAHEIDVQVTAGPAPQWIDHAKSDADLIFSGSEVMMSDFISAIPEIDPATVHPLFLRPATYSGSTGKPRPYHRRCRFAQAGSSRSGRERRRTAGSVGRRSRPPRRHRECQSVSSQHRQGCRQ